MIGAAWRRWVAFLGEREDATSLAIARIVAGVTLVHHLFVMWVTGVATSVWVSEEHGGWRSLDEGWVEWIGGATPGTTLALLAITAIAGVLFTAGLFTRASAFVAWFGFSTLADYNSHSGGSSDELLISVLFLLMFSGCGRRLSLDARLRGGETDAPAWPRRLLLFQLVLMYWTTALQKVSSSWVPGGPLDALWYILQQPTWQKYDMQWLAPAYPVTQLATLVTWVFEHIAPLLLLAYWYRRTADRPGRVRGWFNRVPFRDAYLATGFLLHLGIWLTMEVGPFFGAVLAIYAACFHPAEWQALARRVTRQPAVAA